MQAPHKLVLEGVEQNFEEEILDGFLRLLVPGALARRVDVVLVGKYFACI